MNSSLLPFVAATLAFTACREEPTQAVAADPGPASVSTRAPESIEAVENKLLELENELLREKSARIEGEAEQRKLLGEIKELIEAKVEKATLNQKEPAESAPARTPTEEKVGVPAVPEDEVPRADAEARQSARLEAVGESLSFLITKSGQEYRDLVITRVTDLGVIFRHRTGVARVPFSELPTSWGDRFHADPERTRRALAAEKEAQDQRQQEMARVRQALHEKEEAEAAEERLNQLAQAVMDLRRQQEDGQSSRMTLGGAFLANPFFFQGRPWGLWWNTSQHSACPPLALGSPTVIRPPLIRTDHFRMPEIRSRTIGPVPNLTTPRIRTGNSPRPGSRRAPSIQRVRPTTVIRPSARSRGTSRAIPRSRTVRPSSGGRATRAPTVIRRAR